MDTALAGNRPGDVRQAGVLWLTGGKPFSLQPFRRADTAARVPDLRAGHAAGRGRSARPRAGLPRRHRRAVGQAPPPGGAARLPDRRRHPDRQRAGRRLAVAAARHHAAGVSHRRRACCCSPSPSRWCSDCACEHAAKDAEQAVEEHSHDIAAFPLAIPLMAGPGAITATILLAGQAAYRPAVARGAARGRRRGDGGVPCRHSSPPNGSASCSASPAAWCCRGCSACCSRRSPCNMWSTASARRSEF